MRVDKLTMANAVEARVPFLDHELVELAMAIPADEKVRDGVGKHVLKRAVADLLPHDLLWRPKQGFGTPVSEWFRGPLGDALETRARAVRDQRARRARPRRRRRPAGDPPLRPRRALVPALERAQPERLVRPLDRRARTGVDVVKISM